VTTFDFPHMMQKKQLLLHLYADLAEYGTFWNNEFASVKMFSLVVSLKLDIFPLFLNSVSNPEVSLVEGLGFIFDSYPY